VVDVKNGRIVRIRPLHYDSKYTKDELAPSMWNIEARGKSFKPFMKSLPAFFAFAFKKRVYSPNRVRYPLKRVDWEPGGDPAKINPQNRGKSKFKRISWDEATDIIASEIKRVREKYGPYTVFCEGDGHMEGKVVNGTHGCHMRLLERCGGYTPQIRNPDSWEGWFYGSEHVWGTMSNGLQVPYATLLDISQNTEMFVMQGCDWEVTAVGHRGEFMSQIGFWLADLGTKRVYISPEVNWQQACNPDKWIPVLPNTDVALQLAIIYTWITEDTYDKDYVETHAVGFDKIKAYVMGDEDGVPKTPAWASPICTVPEWTIKALAREWATKKTCTGHQLGGPFIRGPYAHEPARFENILLGMQGWGRAGVHQAGYHSFEIPRYSVNPSTRSANMPGTLANQPQKINRAEVHHALLCDTTMSWYGGTCSAPVEEQFTKYTYPIEDGGSVIHMIWTDNSCQIACWNGGSLTIEGFRSPKIECFVGQLQWLENDLLFCDIVLPVNTGVEEEDIIACSKGGAEFPLLMYEGQAIKSIGESMSDYEISGEIAKKLEKYGGVYENLYEKYTGGKTMKEWMKFGYENSNVQDLISWEELVEKGYFIPPIAPDWQEDASGAIKFYEDPVKNPLVTPTGKLEFYSERLAENFPDDNERPPHPKYVIGGPGWTHDESLWGERCKTYPLLLQSNHPRWRIHTMFDDVPWLREIPTCKIKGYDGYMYETVWLNPTTAAERGIKHGDIVKVYNDRGIELAGAYVTERVIPKMAYMDHGSHCDLITDRINRGGTVNLIAPDKGSKNCPLMVVSAYLVEVEKLDPAEMEEWRKKYPEAFARDYDPAYGLKFSAWIEGDV
jgi:trimethylamine-N-oxide reductase (cytochrome c)